MKRTQRNNSFNVWFGLIVCLLAACASKHPSQEAFQGPRPVPVYQNPIGPQPPVEAPAPTPEASRKEAPELERRIQVVLGGAGVASFATIGLLKRFQEEGFAVESIITTGWPTLFVLGYGFLRSVHDLEWFAMRLKETDLKQLSDSGDTDDIPTLLTSTFHQADLMGTKVPVVVSTLSPNQPQGEIYERGDWKNILKQSMAIPAMWTSKVTVVPGTLHPLDVAEALRRGGHLVVAVDMYDDYIDGLKNAKREATEKNGRRALARDFRKVLAASAKLATVSGRITLGKPAEDLNARRTAILAGYREGVRLAKLIRSMAPPP